LYLIFLLSVRASGGVLVGIVIARRRSLVANAGSSGGEHGSLFGLHILVGLRSDGEMTEDQTVFWDLDPSWTMPT
jgi:hypothetical protein